jgi:hypothetical protein
MNTFNLLRLAASTTEVCLTTSLNSNKEVTSIGQPAAHKRLQAKENMIADKKQIKEKPFGRPMVNIKVPEVNDVSSDALLAFPWAIHFTESHLVGAM